MPCAIPEPSVAPSDSAVLERFVVILLSNPKLEWMNLNVITLGETNVDAEKQWFP